MTSTRKQQICTLLKGIETGDADAANVVDEAKYIQHNPHTHEGSEGLATLFARLAKTTPRVNIVRIFADGDFVFGHTEYDFSSRRIGFEVFRFEGERAVEHWDNIASRRGPNPSGHSMVDGAVEATDLKDTEANRAHVGTFIEEVLIGRNLERLTHYVSDAQYTEHNPDLQDGVDALRVHLERDCADGPFVAYKRTHRILAEGCFVLAVSEGFRDGVHTSFYDLFRLADGLIVEHWDTIDPVPPRTEWKNSNGKF